MTTRRLRSRHTRLALSLLQILAIFGGAKGVVVCVEQSGRVAVEDFQTAQRCRESMAGFAVDAAGGSPAVTAPPTCVDTPLCGALEQASSPARGHDVAVAAPPTTALPLAPLAATRVARTTAPPQPSARILRSVVLLI